MFKIVFVIYFILQPGAIWAPTGNPCVKYECMKIDKQFITVDMKTICPHYDPSECVPVSCTHMQLFL